MKFQAVSIPHHRLKIANYITGFAKPYRDVFCQAGTNGNDLWTAHSYNGFDNPVQRADEQRHAEMGYWYEILRDMVVEGGRGTDGSGRLHLAYIHNAETDFQGEETVLAPPNGWAVPNDDCTVQNGEWNPFYPRTTVPFETVGSMEEAMKRLEKRGLTRDYLLHYFRRDRYEAHYYAGRSFPSSGHGRFNIHLDFRHDYEPGIDRVGSRPRITNPHEYEILEV